MKPQTVIFWNAKFQRIFYTLFQFLKICLYYLVTFNIDIKTNGANWRLCLTVEYSIIKYSNFSTLAWLFKKMLINFFLLDFFFWTCERCATSKCSETDHPLPSAAPIRAKKSSQTGSIRNSRFKCYLSLTNYPT